MDYITKQIQKVKIKNNNNRKYTFIERNQKIRELYATGSYTMSSLGRMYHLSKARIHVIVNNPQEVQA